MVFFACGIGIAPAQARIGMPNPACNLTRLAWVQHPGCACPALQPMRRAVPAAPDRPPSPRQRAGTA